MPVFNWQCFNAREAGTRATTMSASSTLLTSSNRTNGAPLVGGRVMIGATVLGLGGIRTHLQLLCQVLRRAGVAVQVFATGSHWDSRSVANLQSLGVQFIMPPPLVRRSRKLSALHAALSWPLRTPRRANSLYCISPGASQLLLHRLRPRGTTSINHEIVEPPGPESPAGRCAASLDVSVANSRKVAQLMQDLWPAKPIRVIPFLTSDRPAPPPQRGREVGAGLLRVVYLGRLVSQKRPDELVRRWREICQRPGHWTGTPRCLWL